MTIVKHTNLTEPEALDVDSVTTETLLGVNVTLVLPCLNEELAVGSCVSRALEAMNTAGLDGSVLVVDNGSTDNSVNVALGAGARVISQPEPGYGAALRSGFGAATTEYIIMADADGTYELEAIPKLLEPLVSGQADLVLGLRLNDATNSTMPWLHRFVGTPMLSYLVNRATNNKMKVRDSQSGFRAFRREQMHRLNLTSTGMEFASEMLIRSAWADLRIQEVDTTYAERVGESKLSTFSDGLRHLRQILLLSPDKIATLPGVVMTVLSVLLWVVASQSTTDVGRAGSVGWLANCVAGVLSILGPIVLCTGLVLRYRAESLGPRNDHVKVTIYELIRRFFYCGLGLILVSLVGIVVLVANIHEPLAIAASMSSAIRTTFVVGIILASAPLISPFLLASPRLPHPVTEQVKRVVSDE